MFQLDMQPPQLQNLILVILVYWFMVCIYIYIYIYIYSAHKPIRYHQRSANTNDQEVVSRWSKKKFYFWWTRKETRILESWDWVCEAEAINQECDELPLPTETELKEQSGNHLIDCFNWHHCMRQTNLFGNNDHNFIILPIWENLQPQFFYATV